MIIPTLVSQAPGNPITSALWNGTVVGGLQAAQNPVLFKGYATTTQAIASATGGTNVILLDSEDFDTDGGHSTTTNTSRYVCQTAGVYLCFGSVCLGTGNGTGTRSAEILKNGGQINGASTQFGATASNGSTATGLVLVRLAVGDYVELSAWQNSGASQSTATQTHLLSTLNVIRISN
jgi:hypothetical protein